MPRFATRMPRHRTGLNVARAEICTLERPLAIVALVILAVAATVLVVIAAVHLGRERGREAARSARTPKPRWFEVLLAIVLLAVLVALALAVALEWSPEFGCGRRLADGDPIRRVPGGHAGRRRARTGLSRRVSHRARVERVTIPAPSPDTAGAHAESIDAWEARPAVRLLGLLLLALGILVLGWAYLDPPGQAALVLRVLYPASFAVALVLLFDKATRSWAPKGRAEGFREWLLCDLIVVALVLGFLNLEQFADHENYRAFFWDVVHIAAFFLVFWLLDRTQFRGRFLVAAGYLAVLPLLLLLWRWLHEGEAPAEISEISWWSTVWPTFFLGLAFFVLEIISLVAQRGARGHLVPAIKDGVFVALYAIFLIAAAPGGT